MWIDEPEEFSENEDVFIINTNQRYILTSNSIVMQLDINTTMKAMGINSSETNEIKGNQS